MPVPRRRALGPAPGQSDGIIPDPAVDPPADPESVARAICLRLLSTQPRSRAELAAELRRRSVPADAAEAVLSRFAEVGLVDDAAFAVAWVESRHAGRGLGRATLARELNRRGIDDGLAKEAIERLDPETEEASARALVDRRIASTRRLAPEASVRRLVGILARKGYPAGLSMRVVRAALAEDKDAQEVLNGLPDGLYPD
jgi:regulatory protein